jgi:uncharacterized protein YuzE
MNIRYDQVSDAAYIILLEGEAVSRTEQVDTGTLVDLDRLGRAVGVEVIRPARDWPLDSILDRFQVDPHAGNLLRALWHGEPRRFPFEPAQVAASASQ